MQFQHSNKTMIHAGRLSGRPPRTRHDYTAAVEYGLEPSDLPQCAYGLKDQPRLDAIIKAIEKKTRLKLVTQWRVGENSHSIHYQITLGKPLRTGGFNPRASLFLFLPKVDS